jgi:hypothetical protein
LKRERTPMDYFELVETFPKAGCAMCNLLRRDVDRAIDGMVNGFMDTQEMRDAFSQSRGLCSEHGWQLKQNKFGNVLGISKLYAATLGEVLSIIESAPVQTGPQPSRLERLLNGDRKGSNPLADQLEPTERCMVCERIREREVDYAAMFDRFMNETRFQQSFEASDGLCLPHLRVVLRRMSDPARIETLLNIQARMWTELKAQVEAFAAKQNYERIDELTETEGDSWVRAIAQMTGERSLFGVHRRS